VRLGLGRKGARTLGLSQLCFAASVHLLRSAAVAPRLDRLGLPLRLRGFEVARRRPNNNRVAPTKAPTCKRAKTRVRGRRLL
jgi:hypothetical protein